jgi:hypothetical protein
MAFAARARVGYSANFNPKACEYIDRLNEKMGWHLQHALNGGKVTVGPYFLDGYRHSDIIVTNPPFSLFRPFIELLDSKNQEVHYLVNE